MTHWFGRVGLSLAVSVSLAAIVAVAIHAQVSRGLKVALTEDGVPGPRASFPNGSLHVGRVGSRSRRIGLETQVQGVRLAPDESVGRPASLFKWRSPDGVIHITNLVPHRLVALSAQRIPIASVAGHPIRDMSRLAGRGPIDESGYRPVVAVDFRQPSFTGTLSQLQYVANQVAHKDRLLDRLVLELKN